MGQAIVRKDACRLCDRKDLQLGLSLTPTPLANAFSFEPSVGAPRYPLDVVVCGFCGHAQLQHVVDPAVMFREYLYVSGTAPSFVEHFRRYAAEVMEKAPLTAGDVVVEIGSNDGTMLRVFQEAGQKVFGVEPAHNIAAGANAAGIPTLASFFDADAAEQILRVHGPAKVVVANNVLAHIDRLGLVIDLCRGILDDRRGLLVFEVQSAAAMIEDELFDNVYHEHLDFHCVLPLLRFLDQRGFTVEDVFPQPTHGGSLRIYARRSEPGRLPARIRLDSLSPTVFAQVEHELAVHATSKIGWQSMAARVEDRKIELTRTLREMRANGARTIVGYGAPAKATTLLFHLGLEGALDYVVDDSLLKQGRFMPGTSVPIRDPSWMYSDRMKPDAVVVLAWNFAEAIHARHVALGTEWVIP